MKYPTQFVAAALAALLLAGPAHALDVLTPGAVISGAVNGDLNVKANNVTVSNVACTGSLSISANDARVTNSVFAGPRLTVGVQGTTKLVLRPTLIGNRFRAGQGVTSGGHAVTWWNVDGAVCNFNQYDVTVEANVTGDAAEGPWWCFDMRNSVVRSDTIRIHANKACYGLWRWRSDVLLNKGCTNNRFDRFALIVDGAGGNILPSSSANCGGSAAPNSGPAQCIGAWDCVMDSCVIDAKACAASEINWQGGMTGWTITNTRLAANGYALHSIDIHGDRIQACDVDGMVWWDDAYGRPLPVAGDMTYCQNTTSGSTKIDAAIAAVPGWIVTTCGPPPDNGGTTPPAPVDTLRFKIVANPPVTFTLSKVPAIITIVGK